MSYLLLSDYGIIGNDASAALVSRLGSIDWCCFPYLDSPSHFAALLDWGHGGRFQIMPQGDFRSEQRYLQRTNVLETAFETPHGRAVLTDWMPMSEGLRSEPIILRRIEVIDGRVPWTMTCSPRFGYGAHAAEAEVNRGGILFRGQSADELARLDSDVPLEISANGTGAAARFSMEAGATRAFTWAWGRRARAPRPAEADFRPTVEYWREWAHRCGRGGCLFAGPWHDAVTRSSLALKLLMTAYSGSIAEAATTSLPGIPGGGRCWDYRYAWVRDGAMAIQALANLGYKDECGAFFQWLSDILARDGAEGLQPVYQLDGGKYLPERELEHLSGYQDSRPVRVGNEASRMFQLDIYGHILLAAAEYHRIFGELPAEVWPRLAEIAEYACQGWRRPDHGPWEVRSKAEHFVASKVMCWAALDRACSLAVKLGQTVPHRWTDEREILHRTICTQGFDPRQGSFVRAFGENELDAATLVIPLVGFLPADDPRVQGTMEAIRSQLSEGPLLRRYRAADGVPGQDGAHLMASFLYVSCLTLAGRVDEAGDRLGELCALSTPLGLFGEQINPLTGETSGNFPSAAVHLALINSCLYVGMARGRAIPFERLLGMGPPAAAKQKAGRTGTASMH